MDVYSLSLQLFYISNTFFLSETRLVLLVREQLARSVLVVVGLEGSCLSCEVLGTILWSPEQIN